MATRFKNKWSISALLQITAQTHQNRWEYKLRDCVPSRTIIEKVTVYSLDNAYESHVVYRVRSLSYPQYYPYVVQKDSRGRLHTYQRKHFHQYDVVISMPVLSIYAPVKLRTGNEKKWVTHVNSSLIKSKTNPYGTYLSVGDFNAKNGVNGDFYWRLSKLYQNEGILFGKTYAPLSEEPVPFLDKHMINCIETIMHAGALSTLKPNDQDNT
jgi:hypothetical protein